MTKLLFLVLAVNLAFLNVTVEVVKGDYCQTYGDCPNITECCRQNECVKCSNSGCKLNSECVPGQHCCKGSNQCSDWCVRETCAADGDCIGTGKCCRSNICVKSCRKPKGECDYDSDCRSGDYCCKNRVSGYGNCSSNCIGMPCRNYSDCARNEICSSNKCVHVIWCNTNRDCPEKQCCTTLFRCEDCNYDYGMPTWKINVIIFSSIFGGMVIFILLVQCIPCCNKKLEAVAKEREMSGVNHTGRNGFDIPVLSF